MNIKPGQMKEFFPNTIENERFQVTHVTLTEAEVKREKLRHMLNFQWKEVRSLNPDTYTKLIDNRDKTIMMSDTPMEFDTQRGIIRDAHGTVLIAGLGLGIVTLMIQDKPDVEKVFIVERYEGVIELVKPRIPLNNKVRLIVGDIFRWYPKKGVKFDTIYFDIWDNICGDDWEGMKRLHRRFCRFLNRGENPSAFMLSWRKDDFQRLGTDNDW